MGICHATLFSYEIWARIEPSPPPLKAAMGRPMRPDDQDPCAGRRPRSASTPRTTRTATSSNAPSTNSRLARTRNPIRQARIDLPRRNGPRLNRPVAHRMSSETRPSGMRSRGWRSVQPRPHCRGQTSTPRNGGRARRETCRRPDRQASSGGRHPWLTAKPRP